MTIVAVSYGFGHPPYLLSSDQIEVIGRSTFTVFVVAIWASSFARISILCLLLQIAQERVWKGILWSAIALQGASLAACNISQLIQCRPIRSMWSNVPDKECVPSEHIWIVAWVFSGESAYLQINFGLCRRCEVLGQLTLNSYGYRYWHDQRLALRDSSVVVGMASEPLSCREVAPFDADGTLSGRYPCRHVQGSCVAVLRPYVGERCGRYDARVYVVCFRDIGGQDRPATRPELMTYLLQDPY